MTESLVTTEDGDRGSFIEEFYCPEEPLSGKEGFKRDDFGFSKKVKALAEQILQSRGKFTVGIFGPWGSGKTSFGNLLVEKIKQKDKEALVETFKASHYQNEPQPMVALLAALAAAVEEKNIREIAAAFRALLHSLKVGWTMKIPLLGELKGSADLGKALDKEQELLESLSKSLEAHSVFAHHVSNLRELLEKDNALRIFIFLDDLDRCSPEHAVRLLEEIKLILNLPRCVFILALNKNVLDDFLIKQYREKFGVARFSVEEYVGKFIQHAYYLPPLEDDLGKLVKRVLDERLNLKAIKKYVASWPVDAVKIIKRGSNYNPRTALRIINRILYRVTDGCLSENKEPMDIALLAFHETLSLAAPRLVQELQTHYSSRDFLLLNAGNDDRARDFIHHLAKGFPARQLWGLGKEYWRAWLEKPYRWGRSYQSVAERHRLPLLLRPEILELQKGRWQVLELVLNYLDSTNGRISGDDQKVGDKVTHILEMLNYLPYTEPISMFCYQLVRSIVRHYSQDSTEDLFFRPSKDLVQKEINTAPNRLNACIFLCRNFTLSLPWETHQLRFVQLLVNLEMLLFDFKKNDEDITPQASPKTIFSDHLEHFYRFFASELRASSEFILYLLTLIRLGKKAKLETYVEQMIQIAEQMLNKYPEFGPLYLKVTDRKDISLPTDEDPLKRLVSDY